MSEMDYEKETKRLLDDKKDKIVSLRKKIDEILASSLYDRNQSLLNLVILAYHFNDVEWLMTGDISKRRYPIEEIMKVIECSKRVAYDYSNALEALDLCDKLSSNLDGLANLITKLKRAGIEI